ncbi:MAG: VTT domain-containing protein [Planctomycetia bacterium]
MVAWGGYAVLGGIIFAETGLLVGFFLPGDSLLVTAGVFAKTGLLDIWWLHALLIPMAILGDAVNYGIGRRTGPRIFSREDSLFFKKSHLERAQRFYERHGGKTVVLARFLPLVRTFAPYVAGMAGMPYRRFAWFNVLGAVVWVTSLTWLGYLLASVVPNIEKNILVVMAVVIVLSFVPGVVEVLRARRAARREAAAGEGPTPAP